MNTLRIIEVSLSGLFLNRPSLALNVHQFWGLGITVALPEVQRPWLLLKLDYWFKWLTSSLLFSLIFIGNLLPYLNLSAGTLEFHRWNPKFERKYFTNSTSNKFNPTALTIEKITTDGNIQVLTVAWLRHKLVRERHARDLVNLW